jgi:inhibitor of KinA sporulation pathway (predicted exonuclease)
LKFENKLIEKKMDDRNFLALDLEMNSCEGCDRPGKIIQVGIVIGTLNTFRFNNSNPSSKLPYVEKSWFVYPGEKIYPRITELTGITNDDVEKSSTPLDCIHQEIQVLMSTYSCYPNPVVWGNGDSDLFKKEVIECLGRCHVFGHRDIDVKTLHTFDLLACNKKTNSSLKTALNSCKMKFDGIPHRAMDDAKNTLNLFFYLMDRQHKIINLINEASSLK